MNKEYLEKSINNLIQSNGDRDSNTYRAACDYFSTYVTSKFNQMFNRKSKED